MMATRMSKGLRILVSGMIAGDPYQGGATWAVLQYVLGLRAAGHDVYFIEPILPTSIRPQGAALAASVNARYFHEITTAFGLAGRAALLLHGTVETIGLAYADLVAAARECDVLINISGMLTDSRLLEFISRRVYLDLDPAFNQLWSAVDGIDVRLDGHTHFITVGLAIGTTGCAIPTCGRTWLHTLQPIVLAEWPVRPADSSGAWTTVGNWRGYGSIRHQGVLYGQKAHSLRQFIDLPERTRARLQPAWAIHPGEVKDLEALRAHGWDLVDPATVASTPDSYRNFIQQSKGELGIAKSGYVESQCGWFSDRSLCYLASGRPVVAQETGFSRFLPTGEGLLAFSSIDDLVDAIESVNADYTRHCRRARQIAEAHFEADLVLGRLLERVGAANDPLIMSHGGPEGPRYSSR